MSFAEPLRLLWLAPLAAGVLAVLWRHRSRLSQQRSLASPSVWRQVLGGAPSTGLGRMLAWCGAAALIVLALARPQWGEVKGEVSIRTRDVVVAIDVSDSMRCEDVAPSRLKRGLEVLRRALPGLDGNRMAVVVFSGDAYPLVPLTTDLEAVGTFLEGVEPGMIALPGSNLERAVGQALQLLPPEGKGRVLVLISDGENLQGDVDAAASRLREAGVRMVAVVSGTREGGPIPIREEGRSTVHYKRDRSGNVVVTHAHPDVLEKLAKSTGGVLVNDGDGAAAQRIVRAIGALQSREMESSRRVRRVDRFPIFLVGAAVLVLLGFALSPWRKMAAALALVLAFVPAARAQTATPAPPAGASATERAAQEATPRVPWWQRWIPGGERRLARRGLKLWRRHKPGEAARAFAQAASLDPRDPVRTYDLGTSLAAANRLKAAAPLLKMADRAGVHGAAYNLGTAALQAGQASEAVRWLQKALLEDWRSPEVKRNYELALRLQEKQKKQQQQQQQRQDKKKDQKKQQQQQKNQQQQNTKKGEQPKQQARQARGATPTPTPGPGQAVQRKERKRENPLYGALERAERNARKAMRTPVPSQRRRVEEDW